MRLQFLTHLLDSVAALARPRRIVVLGSSSLLPTHPQLGESGQPLELSLDADLLLDPEPLRAHYQRSPLEERDALIAGRHLALLLAERSAT